MMLRKLLTMALVLLLSSAALTAQESPRAHKKYVRKQISTARTNIKNGTSLEAAEQAMRTLLADSDNIDNEKIWLTLFDAIKKQYEQLNEKLYLKQESDTAKFFTHTLHLFEVLESMDSIDARPTAGEEHAPRYRHKHAAYLRPYRKNLYNGGGFYVKRQDYAQAYAFFDAYLHCWQAPLFEGMTFEAREAATAAFWATLCGYKLADPAKVKKYSLLALQDSTKEMHTLQYMAEAYAMEGDTMAYHQVLRQGCQKYINSPYFFKHLALYYSRADRQKDILDIAERVLAAYPKNVDAMVAKCSALFRLEEYEACIRLSDELIALDPTLVPPYADAGLAYYNLSVALSDKKSKTASDRQHLQELYKRALPYLEKFRQLAPTAQRVWGIPLYNIYFNLNMGDEFEELETIIYQ